MKNRSQKCFALALMMVSFFSVAKSPVNCINMSENHAGISSLIDGGKYRYTNAVDSKKAMDFSFEVDSRYSDYLEYAMNEISSKNPRAEMPCPIITMTYQQLAEQHTWSNTPSISQLIAPFELAQKDSDKAILLIHGLTDSPYSYHDLAQFFYQQGFTVRTLLLPGHGTAPSDLLDVSYQQWQQASQYAIERTLKDYEQVYLGGFSTGGALIFDYLMRQKKADEKIKGLFMWSPASKAKSDQAWLAQYVDYIPFVDWIDLDADIDFAKYESFPYNAAAQVHALMSRIVGENAMKNRVMHDIPIFVVASEHDQTIATEQTLVLIEQWQQIDKPQKNKQSTLVYYGDKGNVPASINIKLEVPRCLAGGLCNEVFDVAHTGTINAPNNSHYGVEGQYRNCGHYIKELPRYLACKQSDELVKGELTEANLNEHKLLQRLTYNPYYQQMLVSMESFLQAVQ
ncbi:MAG: alpha/beta fold hydrolase [Colwellia sp.]|nr:alpha/beta fold hydrolase [Colwellia sp.]